MDISPDGDFVISAEFDIDELNRETEKVITRVDLDDWRGFANMEVDSTNAIVYSTCILGPRCVQRADSLFRQRLGETTPELLLMDYPFADFALESDTTLISAKDNMLHRLNLETGESEVLFESDLLEGTFRPTIDPDGRILFLANRLAPAPAEIVRVDVVNGTAEVFTLSIDFANDLDILIVPEPTSVVLLVLGTVALVAYRRRPFTTT